jgi:hypothetical protein
LRSISSTFFESAARKTSKGRVLDLKRKLGGGSKAEYGMTSCGRLERYAQFSSRFGEIGGSGDGDFPLGGIHSVTERRGAG